MNLKAVRGDTNVFDVTMVRQGAGVNLTGAKMWFTAKSDEQAGDNVAAIALNSEDNPTQVVVTDIGNGRFQVQLQPSDTVGLEADAYWYDIQVKEQSGVVTTIANGIFHVVQDVTRAIA